MKFGEKDFDVLVYNPLLLEPGEDPTERWPRLASVFSLNNVDRKSGLLKKDLKRRVMAYILFMYQMDSPLLVIENVAERKDQALKMAGLDVTVKDIGAKVKEYITGRNTTVNKWIVNFCRLQRSTDFAEFVIYENVYFEQLEASLDPEIRSEPNKLKGILDNMAKLKQRLTDLRKTLLARDHNNRGLLSAFEEQVEEEAEAIRLRRENIAELIAEIGVENIVPEANPYGDYKISEMMNEDINEQKYKEMVGKDD